MLVDPKEFANEMSERWVKTLNNALADNLPEAWAIMAESFNAHIMGENSKPITVLPLPTGTGKTQGLSLYCAMLCRNSYGGVLIVTAFKEEADNISDCINQIAKKKIALAEHGDSKNGVKAIQSSPVLIITHSAYQRAADAETSSQPYRSKWDKYQLWDNGQRKLTVVDEAIDIVDSFHITLEQLRLLRSLIPPERNKYVEREVRGVNAVFQCLDVLASGGNKIQEYELIRFSDFSDDFTFITLSDLIPKHIHTHLGYKEKNVDLKKSLIAFVRNTLHRLENIISSWSIYYSKGLHQGLKTARFVLPLEISNFVVLDATAPSNPVTRVLEDHIETKELPKVKSYQNLKLHISTGHGVSKDAMQKISVKEWSSIFDHLNENELKDSHKPLLCVQKSTEDKLGRKHLPLNWDVMHWGAINGRNDWKESDRVVVYGLPYFSTHDYAVILMAFLDWKHQIKGTNYKEGILQIELEYIKKTYKWRHVIVSLVQAINRAHCRNMIEGGNCPKTHVYLFVKHETDKQIIQHHLKELMPDINIKDWDAPKIESNSLGLNKLEEKIVRALTTNESDALNIPKTLDILKINRNTFNNNYAKELSLKKGKLYDAISAIGWQYLSGEEARERLGVYRQHFIRVK